MNNWLLKSRLLKETSGQDLIEYALTAGFVASIAVAITPSMATNISEIFSRVVSVLSSANGV